jgi:hypothetical protein
MWACRPLVDAEACPLSEGDQQARCTRRAVGSSRRACRPPPIRAPNGHAQGAPSHVRQALFRTSCCGIGFCVGIPTKGSRKSPAEAGLSFNGADDGLPPGGAQHR